MNLPNKFSLVLDNYSSASDSLKFLGTSGTRTYCEFEFDPRRYFLTPFSIDSQYNVTCKLRTNTFSAATTGGAASAGGVVHVAQIAFSNCQPPNMFGITGTRQPMTVVLNKQLVSPVSGPTYAAMCDTSASPVRCSFNLATNRVTVLIAPLASPLVQDTDTALRFICILDFEEILSSDV